MNTRKGYTTGPREPKVQPTEVVFEAKEPEPIIYQYGLVYEKLHGFWAGFYRGLIWMYGEEEAKARLYEVVRQMNSGANHHEDAAVQLALF